MDTVVQFLTVHPYASVAVLISVVCAVALVLKRKARRGVDAGTLLFLVIVFGPIVYVFVRMLQHGTLVH